ncbi:carboxymuconolactone decarboxylase family protein [Gluconobacter cerinus]|nr:carboxymuconolactone decarboxylase family protein [Gluconobacter cerinus]
MLPDRGRSTIALAVQVNLGCSSCARIMHFQGAV